MANDDLPLKDTFARFTGGEADVTIAGMTFKAQVGMIGDGYGTPILAGVMVLAVTSEISPTAPPPLIFPEHKASLTLHHDDHKSVYQPVAEWIAEQEEGGNCWFEWVSSEQRQKAIDTDSVWTLQWYPNTPVGFNALAAADLDVLLEAAK
ncbi:hypothetical protein C8D77_111175 [Mesorhizobium loti]|uniref:Uncharacterized protein n=1 Tax=Rhizobium loti TaxID=381 RepID=A0A8E3B3G7_RHILI|nr:hypothetical protein [Mesorhizobium loti]PWJ88452.1 hypothetical protein C8D77_111175 [Mesorhizobium loti]